MTMKKYILLLIFFITAHGLANEQNNYFLSAVEASSDSNQVKSDDIEKTEPSPVGFGWYIQDVTFVDYYFKQKEFCFTPGIASGFSISYKNSLGVIGTFITDGNYTGYFFDASHTVHIKNLDENWIGLTAIVGEITYMPPQQSDAELWIYSAGLAYAFVYPMQWGSVLIGLMADGAYANEEINLNTRLMLELDIPIF